MVAWGHIGSVKALLRLFEGSIKVLRFFQGIVAWGHIHSIRTHIKWYEDTYIVVWGHIYSRMRTHIYHAIIEGTSTRQTTYIYCIIYSCIIYLGRIYILHNILRTHIYHGIIEGTSTRQATALHGCYVGMEAEGSRVGWDILVPNVRYFSTKLYFSKLYMPSMHAMSAWQQKVRALAAD